jgi:UDP-N-acetyl-D-glucosamine/UDP-N-acetyl-D-galactosamine dehydrogenase
MKHLEKLKTLVESNDIKICILGLGYVGLPLAVEFGKKYNTVGFDVNKKRILSLKDGHDATGEVSTKEINKSKDIIFTDNLKDIEDSNIFIVTVPTPVDKFKKPDFTPLLTASKTIGNLIKEGDIVIYESTVYPGATEEECIPILENSSGLKYNVDFYAGYSPERINPGDKDRTVKDILKITSGSTEQVANIVDTLYASIITAGTHKASSIKVAEAAKVIENVQRDVNIGLINELALLFNKLNIDTEEVLKAAGTKWNFLNFRPGLVGGHCIGIDPYYLTYKAESVDFHPEIILAGRKINDSMGPYVASSLVKEMVKRDFAIKEARVLLMGFAFKENCHDLRNTKVIDIIHELQNYGMSVDCYDPWVDKEEAINEYGIKIIDQPKTSYYDSVIVAVSHNKFRDMTIAEVKDFCKSDHIIYDLKYIFPMEEVDIRL